MALEDTFGYRFVRTSLVMLNCLVLLRLISFLLQFSHAFEPAFILFVLLIGSNFMVAIIGAVREHRVSIILTGSVTLVMFLSMIFTTKESKGVNVFLLILLAIAVQSLIFSEMLNDRNAMISPRQGFPYLTQLSSARTGDTSGRSNNNQPQNEPGRLTAVVVYQTGNSNQSLRNGALFMVDSELRSSLAKDPPPSYFASNCPPPKYEDAIKLNAGDLSLPSMPPAVSPDTVASSTDTNQTTSTDISDSTQVNNNNNNSNPEVSSSPPPTTTSSSTTTTSSASTQMNQYSS